MFVGRPEDHERLIRRLDAWPIVVVVTLAGLAVSSLTWGAAGVAFYSAATAGIAVVTHLVRSRRRP